MASATSKKKTTVKTTASKKESSSAAKKTAKKTATKKTSKPSPKKVATKKAQPKTSASKSTAKRAMDEGAASSGSLLGKKAPAFKLQDQSGKEISSASMKGKPYVLYFYPKDNTPGCTRESCEFRDDLGNFRAAGVTVFGVSPDSVKSHAGFASKFELPFSLLSDPEKELAQAYGVWALKKNYGREYWGIVRSTFLIDKTGKVSAEWRQVKVNGHVAAVLAEANK